MHRDVKVKAACTIVAGLSCLTAIATATPIATAHASPPTASGVWEIVPVGNAPTPPMGWNSWNAFGTNIDEGKVMGVAQTIVRTGLAKLGYSYINIDDGWSLKRRSSDGRMIIRTAIFPSAKLDGVGETSFRPFTDHLHAMGLKAGIYSDIGYNVCSQTSSSGNPNVPEGTQQEREVGLYGHVIQDLSLYIKEWGFDYIKVDACGLSFFGPGGAAGKWGLYRTFQPLIVDQETNLTDIPAVRALYTDVQEALNRIKPDGKFVFSLCNWGSANIRAWGKDVGTIWRTSGDIDGSWSHMLHNFDSVITRELYAGPGRWNDPDMLEVGNGQFDEHHLVQARSHFSLWAITAAPLIIGYDLREAPQSILDIVGAPEVVAVNQDKAGNQGVLAYASSDYQIIVKTMEARGEKAVVLFNRTSEPADIQLNAEHLKMSRDQPIKMRDLWARSDIGSFTGSTTVKLEPHGVVMLKVTGEPLLPSGLFLSEMPGRINVAEDGIPALEADPTLYRMVDPYTPSTSSDGMRLSYAGWGGPRADSTPYDRTLRIAGTSYRSGIGALANSRLQILTKGEFSHFSAYVGIDDSTRGKRAGVRFEVYADGKKVAASRRMQFNQPAARIEAEVKRAKVIEIIARQLDADRGNVVITWADAYLQ